jgi:uroporphyrinogen-III synthase
LSAELLKLSSAPRSILIPQSAIGREAVGPLLRAGGMSVLEVATYSLFTERPGVEEQEELRQSASLNGYILFMSSSAVRSTVEAVDNRADLERLKVISIGPTTSEAVRESGLTIAEEAREHTEEGILQALQRAASRR